MRQAAVFRRAALGGVVLAAGVACAACGGPSRATLPPSIVPALAVSPTLPPEAMTRGASDRRSEMVARARAAAGRRSMQSLTWSYVPASASQIAFAPDGTLYALSTGPSGPDKSIWRYVSGQWQNLPGAAKRIAIGADGTLWALTSFGTLYRRDGSTWTTIGGTGADLATDDAGNVFVVAGVASGDNQIWEYAAGAGAFRRAGGYAAHLAGRPDGLLYALTSSGRLYASADGGASYATCAGAVLDVAPLFAHAGFYAIGYSPTPQSGALLYQYVPARAGDCSAGSYIALNGYGTAVAATATQLAVLGTDGAIYTATIASSAPAGTAVAGTVMLTPNDAFGPTTIGPTTYASSDALATTPLAGAAVIVGPVPILGATAPPVLPAGDVMTTTDASGAFSLTIPSAPSAPSSAAPFLVPPLNLSGFVPPATGYYVHVFGPGTDGVTAGMPLPLHRFLAASATLMLRVSTASSAEAQALAVLNQDRANNGAGPLTFDESAEETARLHASDMASKLYLCHYDANNVGPASRYLAAGGLGQTTENASYGGRDATQSSAFAITEAAFMAEKPTGGGHYLNNVDQSHLWAGLGVAIFSLPMIPNAYAVDYELVTPSATNAANAAFGYTNSYCAAGIVVNDS